MIICDDKHRRDNEKVALSNNWALELALGSVLWQVSGICGFGKMFMPNDLPSAKKQ